MATQLKMKMVEVNRENKRLDEVLSELHVSVSERRNIKGEFVGSFNI